MDNRLSLLAASFIACLGLAACDPPPGADVAPTEAARAAPPPMLAETARFDSALAQATPDKERLQGEADALAARAAALNARAGALQGPILPPEDRQRLEAAQPAP